MIKLCPACSAEWQPFMSTEDYQIVRCPQCGLGHTSALNAQQGDYHRDEVYIHAEDQFANIFERRVKLITDKKSQSGAILDIGSSTGLMLSLFKKRGWQVQGIEMSKPAATFAQKRGIPTMVNTFEKASLKTNSYDAVIMNQTLEHLEDAAKVLEKIAQILKPGGVVLIDVPNFGGWSAQHQKEQWSYLLPDEHVWHFTATSLEKLLTKHGFQVIKVTNPSGIWDYGNPLKELWQSLTGGKKRFFPELLTALPDWFITQLHKGTSLTVLAEKR